MRAARKEPARQRLRIARGLTLAALAALLWAAFLYGMGILGNLA